jgi:hypothetical protein
MTKAMMKLLGTPSWSNVGPHPIALQEGSITGAIQSVVGQRIRRPGSPDIFVLYVGAVNGGVWRADNFTEAMLRGGGRTPPIQWSPLTDGAPTLSIASLAIDPRDPNGNTLWAGTGHFSSAQFGGPAVGLLRTTNAKDALPTWTLLGDQAAQPPDLSLSGQRIVSVVPTALIEPTTGEQVILAAAYDGLGIVRSTNGGRSFQAVQGPAGPLSGFATDLVADPNDPQILYAALRATYDDQQNLVTPGGIFRSTDGGVRWTAIHNGIPQAVRAKSFKLALFNNAGRIVATNSPTILYVGEADTSGRTNNLVGIFRSTNPHATDPQWTPLFFDLDPTHVPSGLRAGEWPASASVPYFGFAVDPNDWNNFYLGGMTWFYRVQATLQPNNRITTQWRPWGGGGGWDYRSMTFLTSNILLCVSDPGIFGLVDPASSSHWVSLNNSLALTEFFSIAYDPTTGVVCGGTQDVGTPVQNICGGWTQLPNGGGDGRQTVVAGDGVSYYVHNDVFHRTQGSWHTEEDLGGVLTSAPGACSWGPCRLDIFYRGQNEHLWHRSFDVGWHNEEDLGGVLSSSPAACTWGPGRVDIFYRGQNNHLWHRWFDAGDGGWHNEEDLGGVLSSSPAACTWGPGRVDIFYRGQNNHLWHRWFDASDGGWHNEQDLGGVLSSSPAACTWGPGRVDIFYRGQNNHLWHRWFDAGDGGWHNEEDLRGSLTTAPGASTWGPGRVDVFYGGQNDQLWYRGFDGGWKAEVDLGDTLSEAPTACSWWPGRVDVFYRGEDDQLSHRWFDRSGSEVTPAAMPTLKGDQPLVVNPANPKQLLFAGGQSASKLFETPDRGDTITDITPPGLTGAITAVAYGASNPSAAYVATSTPQLFLRTSGTGSPRLVGNFPGTAAIADIAVDRNDWRRAVVLSQDGALFFTTNGGATWNNIRGNIGSALRFMRTIEVISVGGTVVVLVAGDPPNGNAGIVRAIDPDPNEPQPNVNWTPFGIGLPRAIVMDLHYYPSAPLHNGRPGGDLLLVGTFGRGAWLVTGVTSP